MTLPSLPPEENPFNHLKSRHIFLCFFLVLLGSIFLFYSLIFVLFSFSLISDFDDQFLRREPIIPFLLYLFGVGLATTLIMRELKLIQIQPKAIIGKLPSHFNWLPIIGILLAMEAFLFGAFRVLYYPLSFIFPSWIESILRNDLISPASQSFSPFFYYLLLLTVLLVHTIVWVFILEGIVLHRWSTKMGIKSALIMLCIIYSITFPQFFIGGISLCLMLSIIYIKTKTLIVPIVIELTIKIVGTLFLIMPLTENSVENFRSQFGIGVFCLAISTPLLIWLLYKNRIRPNEQMPYFANLQQLRSNE